MFYRQKLLLAVIQIFGGKLHHTDLQKYLFLFTKEHQKEKSYHFVPYKFGCFSFQSYSDIRTLTNRGFLSVERDWVKNYSPDQDYLNQLRPKDFEGLNNFYKKYKSTKGKKLIREVYLGYPYYASRSAIAAKILTTAEIQQIKKAKPKLDNEACFFTIGYEGISFETFLNKLIQNNVKLLCDVRANPLSRKYGFSKKTLSGTLEKLNIEYHHMPDLGITSQKRKSLKTFNDYEKLFSEYEKTTLKDASSSLEKLFQIFLRKKRVAITCFEANPCMCHRSKILDALAQLPEWKFQTKHL